MNRVVYDIETIGTPFEELDEQQQKYFLRWASSPEQEAVIRTQTALYSLTGQIVSIALLNPETKKGRVYTIGKHKATEKNEVEYLFVADEKELLRCFWNDAREYQQFITFNGRCFDAPYILIRSAINKVKQTTDIMGYRYRSVPHLDLADQMSFFGAAKHMPLHFYCEAFHIKSPKGDMTGLDVPIYFKAGKYVEIATYCFGDVRATAELLSYWDNFLSPATIGVVV